jgi:hypothetical protein
MRWKSVKRWPTLLVPALLLASAAPGAAYTTGSDAVVFRDHCDGHIYAINPDGSGRRRLEDTGDLVPLDVSTGGGPPTALAVGPSDLDATVRTPPTLYALDPDGAGAPVNLLAPTDPTPGTGHAAFSPDGGRIAYVHAVVDPDTNTVTALEVHVGDVQRDTGGEPTGLANITFVVDLLSLGERRDSNASAPYVFTGPLDFARDGLSIVVVIYDDLWRVSLADDGRTFAGAVPLTRTTDFAERFPRWSPVADVVAYEGGPYSTSSWDGTVGLSADDVNVYTLDVVPGVSKRVTTSKNKGSSGPHRNRPAWSPDGRELIFSAQGQSGKRNAPCGSAVNYDLFRIAVDGSAKAVAVTNTVGSGVEVEPAWGWSE